MTWLNVAGPLVANIFVRLNILSLIFKIISRNNSDEKWRQGDL